MKPAGGGLSDSGQREDTEGEPPRQAVLEHRLGEDERADEGKDRRRGSACLKLLPRHRKVEPLLWCDEVIVAVLADIQLHPLDLTGEAVAGRAVIR
jgi:hypothetical protein